MEKLFVVMLLGILVNSCDSAGPASDPIEENEQLPEGYIKFVYQEGEHFTEKVGMDYLAYKIPRADHGGGYRDYPYDKNLYTNFFSNGIYDFTEYGDDEERTSGRGRYRIMNTDDIEIFHVFKNKNMDMQNSVASYKYELIDTDIYYSDTGYRNIMKNSGIYKMLNLKRHVNELGIISVLKDAIGNKDMYIYSSTGKEASGWSNDVLDLSHLDLHSDVTAEEYYRIKYKIGGKIVINFSEETGKYTFTINGVAYTGVVLPIFNTSIGLINTGHVNNDMSYPIYTEVGSESYSFLFKRVNIYIIIITAKQL
jgi:hypothetical protein